MENILDTTRKNIKELEKIQKEWEIFAANIMVGPHVKNYYQSIKTSYNNKIYADVNSFYQTISNTKKLVETTIDGKTYDAIINRLNKLGRNSEDLINGANSIKANSSTNSIINIFAFRKLSVFKAVKNRYGTIQMLDSFINTRDLIMNSTPTLIKIKRANQQLLNEMESKFEVAITQIEMILPRLSFQEVKDIATSRGLLPQDSIDLNAVNMVSMLVDQKIQEIDQIANDITVTYLQMQNRDKTAYIFNSSLSKIGVLMARAAEEKMTRFKNRNNSRSEAPANALPPTSVQEPPIDLPLGQPTNFNVSDNPYPFGQCTWYAWGRRAEIGKPIPWFAGEGGNAQNWIASAQAQGLNTSYTPSVGSVVVFQAGVAGADPYYGHVAIVEEIQGDSILISESNIDGSASGAVSYRSVPLGAGMSFIE